MVDPDIILSKTGTVRKCLRRISDVTHGKPGSLDELDAQDIFVLNLQRAMQAAIDLAAHVVAQENLGLPESLKENFVLINNAGIIDAGLSQRLQSMVGFRNIAVHDYQQINVEVLKAILTSHLADLDRFCTCLLQKYGPG